MKIVLIKFLIVTLVLFFINSKLISQELDSLLSIVNNTATEDTTRLKTYEKISNYYYSFDLDSMIYYNKSSSNK